MKAKVLIVYASLTGNTEAAAKFLALCFKSMEQAVDILGCQQVNASSFLAYDICVVATYTYGSAGDLPDEIYDLYEELGELNLQGKIYGTLGTGEEDYGYFCKSADDFASQFEKAGAQKGAEVLKIEESPSIEDKKRIAELAKALLETWQTKTS